MDAAKFTIGIEEEYQVIDPASGGLVGRAPDVLDRDGGRLLKPEFQRTMVEVATQVGTDVEAAVADLRARRRAAAAVAAEQGLALAAAGLHPMGPHPAAQLSDDEHYWKLAARGGIVARELHIFGMHVHVGVPDEDAAVRALGALAVHAPPLLALTASSPFHRGRDTQFHSFRTMLRDMFPRVGPPLPLDSAAEYRRMLALLAGTPEDDGAARTIAWDIRPSAQFPTVEFRFFDVTPWLDSVALVVACVRALVAVFVDSPPPPLTGLQYQLLRENRWQAARYGLDGRCLRLDPPDGKPQPMADALRATVELVGPTAESLGDGAALAPLEELLERGTAADAMRRVRRRSSSLRAVTEWAVAETGAG